MKKTALIITVIMFFLLLGWVLRLITPPPSNIPDTPIPPNFDGSRTSFAKISYSGSNKTFPSSLPIGAVNLSSNKDRFLSAILTKFSLQPVTKNFWESDEYQLSYSEQSDQFVLSTSKPPSQIGVVSQVAAKIMVDDFLQAMFGGNPELQPVAGSTQFMSGFPEATLVAPSLASLINSDYSQAISGVPIVFDVNSSFPLNLTVDSDSRITKLVYQPQYVDFYEQSVVNTISISDAVKNINRGQGSVISAFGTETAFFALDSIQEGVMNSVSLEYRVLPESNQTTPFFRFSGSATTGDGNKIDVQIITPANK